jgi:tRNA threonylcarbamoyladenosine biosynthesis protein TsaE
VLAQRLGSALSGGQRIYLSGDLGAGKTRLVRGLLRGLGHTGRVRSPTFTLLEPYDLLSFRIYHFDFYRFSSQNEWRDAGFDEALSDSCGVCLIEWPEMAGATLPSPDLHVTLQVAPDLVNKQDDEATTQRLAQLQAQSPWAQSWLSQLCQLLGNGPHEGISLRPA